MSSNLSNPDAAKTLSTEAQQLVQKNEGVWAQFQATELIPEEVRLSKIKTEQHAQYVQSTNQVFQLAASGKFEAAAQHVSTDTMKKFSALRETVFTLFDLQRSASTIEYNNAQTSYESTFSTTAMVIIASFIFAAIFGYLLLRSIIAPLDEAVAIANAVATGDLTRRIEVNSTNETGRLLQALKTMNDNLSDLVEHQRAKEPRVVVMTGKNFNQSSIIRFD